MDLKDFTLLKEDDNSYTVGHPKGRSLTIAKQGLSGKAQELISKLKKTQNLDEGGSPADPEANATQMPSEEEQIIQEAQNAPAQQPPLGASADWGEPNITASAEQAASGQDQAAVQPQGPQMAGQGAPDLTQSLQEEKGAIQAGATAQEKAAGEQQTAITELEKASQAEAKSWQDKTTEYNKQDQAFQAAMNDPKNKIDPNRYFANMSTPAKIGGAIAMIVSGIGAGLSGQPNLAMKLLNDSIERDIDAQKNDQSKTMNLWKMNREKMQSDAMAHLAAQNQLLSVAKTKLLAATYGAAGAQAKANAAPTIAAIDNQIGMNNWMKAVGGGQAAPGSETEHVNNMRVMQQLRPDLYKDMESKYIPGMGVARVAPSPADREALTSLDQIDKGITRAINFAKTEGTTLPLTTKNQEANDIQNGLQLEIGNLVNLKRINEFEAKKYTEMARNPGAWRTQAAIQSFNDLQKKVQENRSAIAKNLGISAFSKGTNDQQAMAWARANPNDPRAQQIMAKLGAQ